MTQKALASRCVMPVILITSGCSAPVFNSSFLKNLITFQMCVVTSKDDLPFLSIACS